jgi:ABC-type transporter Mla MlaB component
MTAPDLVESVGAGDHACLTFTDPEERLDLVADFVHAGLAAGHKVLCLTEQVPAPWLPAELAEREVPVDDALRRGQLDIAGTSDIWLAGQEPDAERTVAMLAGYRDRAAEQGYPVLRVTADMSWATGPVPALDQLAAFEARVAELFADGGLCAICQYDRERFDAVTLAMAASVHPRTVAATVYHEDPILRICRQHRPPGVRVAGEIDFTRAEPLVLAVTEALRLDGDVHVNLRHLRYLDAACAGVLIDAARSMASGRQMIMTCGGLVNKVLTLAGARDVPQLRVHNVDGTR